MSLVNANESTLLSTHDLSDSLCTNETPIRPRANRRTYVITYPNADTNVYSRQSFAAEVVFSFEMVNSDRMSVPTTVEKWVCSLEETETAGFTFQMAIKLSRGKRWRAVKTDLEDRTSISVNFSEMHDDYFSAWTYVTKSDPDYLQNLNHGIMTAGPPSTFQATQARRQSTNITNSIPRQRCHKTRKMTNMDFSKLVVDNNCHTLLEVQALAKQYEDDGRFDLKEFIINRSKPEKISDLLNMIWGINDAPAKLFRSRKSRIELLNENLTSECTCIQQWEWKELAVATLHRNSISPEEYSSSLIRLLTLGRGKHRNILHVGPSNCGKSFLLQPLKLIYESFENPATCTFNWIGVDEKELIILNDFRWSSNLIPWEQLLQLLEGDTVNFPAPKNISAKDISLKADTPVVATSSDEISFIKSNILNERQTTMMANRWKKFQFTVSMREEEIKECNPCKACYARFVYSL